MSLLQKCKLVKIRKKGKRKVAFELDTEKFFDGVYIRDEDY